MLDKVDKELIESILSKGHPSEVALDNNCNVIDNNIHVDKDEDIKDFFVSWKKFKHRPSKISLFSQFDSEILWDILRKDFTVNDSNINKVVEIFPEEDGIIYNMKYFISVTDDISLSFFEFDREEFGEDREEIYSSNLTIYYNQKKVSVDAVNDILTLLQSSMIDLTSDDDSSHKTINSLHINLNNSFELKPLQLNESVPKKDMKFYYNKNVLDSSIESIDLINSSCRGVTILDGIRGTGKTTFLTHMINSIDKKIIYVPSTVIEHTLNNIDFIDFIKLNPNSVFVFDDCENFFSRKVQKVNLFATNLLQILDGISSNSIRANFLLVMNVDKGEIDTNLLDSNNFLSNITFSKLNKNIANRLSKKLGKNEKFDNSVKLNDVIRGKSKNSNSTYY